MTQLKVDTQLRTLDGLRDPKDTEGALHDKACPRCLGTGTISPSDPDYTDAANKPVTMRRLIVNSLLTSVDTKLSGEEKLKRGVLAQKVHLLPAGGVIKLESGEIQLIKKQIGDTYNTLVVMQAWPILEGATSELVD